MTYAKKKVFSLQTTKYGDRNIMLTSWWSPTAKKNITLHLSEICLLSLRVAPNTMTQLVCPLLLYCFSQANLLKQHLPECSIHPEQKIEYPTPKNDEDTDYNVKYFKASRNTLPFPFVLFCDFEAGWRREGLIFEHQNMWIA